MFSSRSDPRIDCLDRTAVCEIYLFAVFACQSRIYHDNSIYGLGKHYEFLNLRHFTKARHSVLFAEIRLKLVSCAVLPNDYTLCYTWL